MEQDIALDLEIRGQVAYIVRKHKLSVAASADIYKMFCEQARRWESKVNAHTERICNQRKEIKRLIPLASAAPAHVIDAYSTDNGSTWHDIGKPLEK